jgi:hypothetical protein
MLKSLALLLATALLLGCANKPTGPKPVVRSIAILPATLPTNYSLQNLSSVQLVVPIAGIGYAISSKEKAKVLTQRMAEPSFRIDEDLTNAVADTLRKKGYEVTILTDVKRRPNDPDSLEVSEVKHTSDALVHVYFTAVGVVSPRNTTEYFPRMNAFVLCYTPANKSYPYETSVYYGFDADDDKSYSIAADASEKYGDFDVVLNSLEKVRTNFRASARKVGERLAEQVHVNLR